MHKCISICYELSSKNVYFTFLYSVIYCALSCQTRTQIGCQGDAWKKIIVALVIKISNFPALSPL